MNADLLHPIHLYGIDAILNLDIEYVKRGIVITIKRGTRIKVDMVRDIALINTDYVHIEQREYSLVRN